jgi:carbamate kinase
MFSGEFKMRKTAVVALGGNAIMRKQNNNIERQFANTRKAIRDILFLARKYSLVITHGNGPQVGNILIQIESAIGRAYTVPLSVAVAESQGQIGYIIEQAIQNELQEKPAVSVLTQVLVDRKDPAFRRPTKPIGPFYTKQHAALLKKKGMAVMEDAGRGWRRVVPSPYPKKIIEAPAIKEISRRGIVVVAAGGGGIPVYKKAGKLVGIDAVIDKDLASCCLAKSIGAELLIILTDVDSVYLNYGRPNQKPIKKMSSKQAHRFNNHFAEGSMRPKVEAAAEFAESGGSALITSPSSLRRALKGNTGTWVVK